MHNIALGFGAVMNWKKIISFSFFRGTFDDLYLAFYIVETSGDIIEKQDGNARDIL